MRVAQFFLTTDGAVLFCYGAMSLFSWRGRPENRTSPQADCFMECCRLFWDWDHLSARFGSALGAGSLTLNARTVLGRARTLRFMDLMPGKRANGKPTAYQSMGSLVFR